MTEKSIQKLFEIKSELEKFHELKKYSFSELLRYFNFNLERFQILKALRPKFKNSIIFKNELILVPLFSEINGKIIEFKKKIDIFEPFTKCVNAADFKIQLSLTANWYYEFQKPYNTVKIVEHKWVADNYFTFLKIKNNEIESEIFYPKNYVKPIPPKSSKGPSGSAKKRLGVGHSKTSLGHTSFNHNATARLLAEAADPPGLLIGSNVSLPHVSGPYKYMSTAFSLETESIISEEQFQIVMFNSVAEKDSFPRQTDCKYFDCNFTFP